MRSDLCLPLKVRLGTVQLTLSFSLTRDFTRTGRSGWCQLYTACFFVPSRELEEMSFQLLKLSVNIYEVPGTVLQLCQGGKVVGRHLCQNSGGGACKAGSSMACLSPLLQPSSHAVVICSQKSGSLALIDELLSPL